MKMPRIEITEALSKEIKEIMQNPQAIMFRHIILKQETDELERLGKL